MVTVLNKFALLQKKEDKNISKLYNQHFVENTPEISQIKKIQDDSIQSKNLYESFQAKEDPESY